MGWQPRGDTAVAQVGRWLIAGLGRTSEPRDTPQRYSGSSNCTHFTGASMRRRHMAGLLAAVVVAGASLSGAAPAAAATDTLYVNNTAAATCSDSGSGSQSQPYCTIMAAVAVAQPGQTVLITGIYGEHMVLSRSGMPGAPITFQGTGPGIAQLQGAGSGLDISGQHDLVITGMNFATGGVAISNSSAITFQKNDVFSIPG